MNEQRARLALSQIQGLDINLLTQLLKQMDILQLSRSRSAALIKLGLKPAIAKQFDQIDWQQVDQALAWIDNPVQHFVSYDDEIYPPLLKQITDAPPFLYIKGDLECLSKTAIAMVGSRKPTPAAIDNAVYFAAQLAALGLVVVSGLAYGIDKASHEGALQTGTTIAVLGSGLENIYPKRHQALVEDIINQGGALISEFPLTAAPQKWHFPLRNRIISGLSVATLVVEASRRSGSLITARIAAEQGREVLALPGSITNQAAAGCLELIKQGAALIENCDDIIQELMTIGVDFEQEIDKINKNSDNRLEKSHTDPIYASILAAIDEEPTAVDVIANRCALSVNKVNSLLTELELDNYITSQPGGFCKKRRKQ